MQLYQVPRKLEEIMEIEDHKEQKLALKNLKLQTEDKIEAIITFARNTDLDIEIIDKEIERLTELKRVRKKKADSLRGHIKTLMEVLGLHRFTCPSFSLSIVKNPVSVQILNEDEIPDEYKVDDVKSKVDKAAIKEVLKKGEDVPGAMLVDDKTTLRIK